MQIGQTVNVSEFYTIHKEGGTIAVKVENARVKIKQVFLGFEIGERAIGELLDNVDILKSEKASKTCNIEKIHHKRVDSLFESLVEQVPAKYDPKVVYISERSLIK